MKMTLYKFSDFKAIKALNLFPIFNFIGMIVCILCGGYIFIYMKQMHETLTIYSMKDKLKRELLEDKDTALYFSFYKNLINSPSFLQGIYNMIYDNSTEYPDTINILARMNVYQDIILAGIYKYFPLANSIDSLYFYVYAVHILHSVIPCTIFLLSWISCGSWFYGFVSFAFYVLNINLMTRAMEGVAQREHFALPAFWLQLLFIHIFFREKHLSKNIEWNIKIAICICTFWFSLMWHFNQYALLLQAITLFICQILNLVNCEKIMWIYLCHLLSLLLVCLLQFVNTLILSGICISFLLACIVVLKLKHNNVWLFNPNQLQLSLNVTSVLLLTLVFNKVTNIFIHDDGDEHIYKLVMMKLGFNNYIDFYSTLYRCMDGYQVLSPNHIFQLVYNFLYLFHGLAHCSILIVIFLNFLIEGIRLNINNQKIFHLPPEIAFHAIQISFFGLIGLLFQRFIFIWCPYMTIMASIALSSHQPWVWLAEQYRVGFLKKTIIYFKNALVVILIAGLLAEDIPEIVRTMKSKIDMSNHDVEDLAKWIISNTPPDASFSGNPMLMATIKLGTGRAITTHPLSFNKNLRNKVKDIFKIYGNYSAEEIYEMLMKYNTDYFILQNKLCYPKVIDSCELTFMMDQELAWELHINEDNIQGLPSRFCHKIKEEKLLEYEKRFKLVFINSFRVYKVIRPSLQDVDDYAFDDFSYSY